LFDLINFTQKAFIRRTKLPFVVGSWGKVHRLHRQLKMTDGFYVMGLSAVDPDMQLNEQLLKHRSWFYIPIVYTNSGRAILAMEKGPPGDRAFAEAFAAWEMK
jgi:hypothetical protein